MDHKYRILATASLILAGLGLISIFQFQNLEKTRLVFCDVGQGDGILIASGSKQVVIDGGPGNKIVDCLGEKMPFWDRQIEMVVITHPQRDHLEGLIGVLARYDVGTIVTTRVRNDTDVFRTWERVVEAEQTKVYVPDIGDRFVVDERRGTTLTVLWPDREQSESWQQNPPGDLNKTSIVMRLDTGSACAYLTSDIPKEIILGLIDRECQLLKISHHGSRTGTNKEILEKVNPKIAVIQVGKNNRFGHPHKEVIDILVSKGISRAYGSKRLLRTDIDGTVEIKIDGGHLTIDI